MPGQPLAYNSSKNPYLQQQVKTASPEKIISLLYDYGMKSCRAKDRQKASKVLVELISALNFDYGEISVRYFDLYRFALDQVNKGKFDHARIVLEELGGIWETAIMNRAEIKN